MKKLKKLKKLLPNISLIEWMIIVAIIMILAGPVLERFFYAS